MTGLAETVDPTDIEEGMRVGVDRGKYQIHLPLPTKIDATVAMMQVEDKPDVTYADIGGCKEQIEKLREVVEKPLLNVSHLAVYLDYSLFSPNVSSSWASNHQKEFCCTDHQVAQFQVHVRIV